MEKMNVLLVEDNWVYRDLMREYLSEKPDIDQIYLASNGMEALEHITAHQPDVMVMDLVMPKLDGFGLLEQMARMDVPKKPEPLILSALGRDDFVTRAMNLGAKYYLIKPFDLDVLYRRLQEMASPITAAPAASSAAPMRRETFSAPPRSIDERVTNIFLSIGIPAHIKGYHFLREAIKMVLEDGDLINRITKELYPGIAKRFNTTSSKVERAIRHAIEVAWGRGRFDSIQTVLANPIYCKEIKPTNGEFIALVADRLRLERTA